MKLKSNSEKNIFSGRYKQIPFVNINKMKDTKEYPISRNTKKNDETKEQNKKGISKILKMKKSFSYRFFEIETRNKKKSLTAKSLGIKTINENNNINSRFINLSKDANKYTSNADYIKNKKMQIFDVNNLPFSERGTNTQHINLNNNKILYKTIFFRGGKYYFNKEKKGKRLIKKIEKNMPIENIIDYLEQNEENLNIFNKDKKRKYIIEGEDIERKKLFNCSFYEELMYKKNEILNSLLLGDKINKNKNKKIYNKIINYNTNKTNNDTEKKNNYFSNLLFKKEEIDLPLVFPKFLTSSINFGSIGRNSRYQNIQEIFGKIKILFEKNKKYGNNNNDLIEEFLINKRIDTKYLNKENIMNLYRFINLKELPINIDKTLKENIIMALNFNEDNEKKYILTFDKSNEEKKHLKKIIIKNKLIKRDELSPKNYITIKNKLNQNKINYKSLKTDLLRQKKLSKKDSSAKTDLELKEQLKNELFKVDDEIKNKQLKINEIENNLNLIPFSLNYFNTKKLEKKNNNKKENKIQFGLVSLQELRNYLFKNNNIEKNQKSNESDIFKSNERLYYSWFRDKKKCDINKFLKRTKLTEFVIYNKTKEKIVKNKILNEGIYI